MQKARRPTRVYKQFTLTSNIIPSLAEQGSPRGLINSLQHHVCEVKSLSNREMAVRIHPRTSLVGHSTHSLHRPLSRKKPGTRGGNSTLQCPDHVQLPLQLVSRFIMLSDQPGRGFAGADGRSQVPRPIRGGHAGHRCGLGHSLVLRYSCRIFSAPPLCCARVEYQGGQDDEGVQYLRDVVISRRPPGELGRKNQPQRASM